MMRILTFAMASAALAMTASGPVAAMAPASGTIVLRATATFSDGTTADRLYAVRLDADSDGDGIGDETWLRVRCDDKLVAALFEYEVKAPRDVATGQASGKRQHKPFTIIKEWGASTPMLGQAGGGGGGGGGVIGSRASWDLATAKGARAAVAPPYNIKENKRSSADHSGASDASAGKGAKDGAKPSVATYDLKKLEGARTAGSGQMAGSGQGKTMAHDSWHEAKLTEGSPNLCD